MKLRCLTFGHKQVIIVTIDHKRESVMRSGRGAAMDGSTDGFQVFTRSKANVLEGK